MPSPSTPAESWTIYVCECGLISEGKDTHYRIGHAERVIQVIPRAPAEQRIEGLEGVLRRIADPDDSLFPHGTGGEMELARAALCSTEEQEAEGG